MFIHPSNFLFQKYFRFSSLLLLLAFSESWVKQGRKIIIRQWKLGLFRGLLIAAAQFCYYLSLRHIEFAIATTISLSGPYLSPFFRHRYLSIKSVLSAGSPYFWALSESCLSSIPIPGFLTGILYCLFAQPSVTRAPVLLPLCLMIPPPLL